MTQLGLSHACQEMQFILTITIIHAFYITESFSQAAMYSQQLRLDIPEQAQLLRPLVNGSRLASTRLICASLSVRTLREENKALRASAFHNNEGGYCNLYQTPTFSQHVLEATSGVDHAQGVFYNQGAKPSGPEPHPGLYFFLLFNEERVFDIFNSLPQYNHEYYDGITRYFEFSMPSPIQTVEGQFAAHVINNAYLEYIVPKIAFKKFTIMAWYNPGPNHPEIKRDIVITVTHLPRNWGGFSFWSSYSLPNDLILGMVFNDHRGTVMGSPENTLEVDEWAYIGTTYDGDTGTVILYKNAMRVAEALNNSYYIGPGPFLNLEAIQIGYRQDEEQHFMKGYLASVELYVDTLSDQEIQEAMEKSRTARSPPEFH